MTILLILTAILGLPPKHLAFPSAEGYGRWATGGRGGSVYHVTNLNDSGTGSLREAVSRPNRTVVFDLSGVIPIKTRLKVADHITIAGQTAPGEGIVVYGNGVSFSRSNNDIVRYMRFRGSITMSKGTCTLIADSANNIIFDHVSVEWGRWDNLHIKNSSNITLQYCIIAKGIDPQRFGALLENPTNITIHHCLWADNQSRNPKTKAKIELINNIIYNWGSNGLGGGHSSIDHFQDIIGNYFIAGPNSSDRFIGEFKESDHVFERQNYVDLNKDGKSNGTLITDSDFLRLNATIEARPHVISYGTTQIQSATDAYVMVVSEAGASLYRDKIDAQVIASLKSLGKKGNIIRTEAVMGGQQPLSITHSGTDTDQDGMPDEWEKKNGFNSSDAIDGKTIGKDGYSNLEHYLQWIVKPQESK